MRIRCPEHENLGVDSSLIRGDDGAGSTRPDLEVRLLGGLQIKHDGVPLPLGGQRAQCVLAVLLLNRGRTVSRDDLAEWAWPSPPPDTVDRQIANYVAALRRALRPVGDRIQLLARRPGFTALVEPSLLDNERFALLAARAHEARTTFQQHLAVERLSEALGLWCGRPLDGLETPYLRRRALALEAERRDAATALSEAHLEAGRPALAAALLRDLAARDPGNEAVTAALVRALTGAGQAAEAAEFAARAERAAMEQGRTPGSDLRRAHSDALSGHSPVDTSRTGKSPQPHRQLPSDTGAFTGREEEVTGLVRLAKQAQAGSGPGTVVICALDGMGGVGKTALAVHVGHLLLDEFPDGQLFIDLHGYTQGIAPRDPADALAAALQALGTSPHQIPADLDTRAALFRERLSGTSTLVLLDNAASEAQIRPLLPASEHCLVLVTSRRRLKGLDDAHVLPLDVLPAADAAELFRQVAGPGRIPADDPLLERIIALCGKLPLALRMAAAIFRNRPVWTLEWLALKLSAAPTNLEAFFDGDRNLAAVFDLSYRSLSDRQQHAFRCLGLIPGPDLDTDAAAALLDTDPQTAERLLQELADHSLLSEPTPGRHRMHDLIRLYASALVADDPDQVRDAAFDRLLTFYQHTAARADALIAHHTRHRPADTGPAHPPALPDHDTALGWLRAERTNIEACLGAAVSRNLAERVIALTAGLAALWRTDGPLPPAIGMHAAALAAARRTGDRQGQARALAELGDVQLLTGDHTGAARDLEAAHALFRSLDDPLGQAIALTELGDVRFVTGDFPGAVRDQEAALELFRGLDDRLGQATALTQLGAVRSSTGDHARAARDLETARDLFRGLGDRHGQAHALSYLGYMQWLTGDHPAAMRDLEASLELFRDLGHRLGQANVTSALGQVRSSSGDHPGAMRDLEAALEMFREHGHRHGTATALASRGRVRLLTGDPTGAALDLEEALGLFRSLGDRGSEATALNHRAAVFLDTGEPARALALHREALQLSRAVHKPDDEALALAGIGECLLRQGEATNGVGHLRQALETYRRLGMRADLERIRTRLTEVEDS